MNILQGEPDSALSGNDTLFLLIPVTKKKNQTTNQKTMHQGTVGLGEKRQMGAGGTQKGPSKQIHLGQVARKWKQTRTQE